MFVHVWLCRLWLTECMALGWRDVMINLRITGANPHICEIQVWSPTRTHTAERCKTVLVYIFRYAVCCFRAFVLEIMTLHCFEITVC